MTPGSAGGELGDHGALRRGEIIPRLTVRCRRPTRPSRVPPIGSQPNHGRNLRSFGSVPFAAASAQLWAAPVSSPVSRSPGSAEGGIGTRSCDCGSHVQRRQRPAAAQSATLKGNSLPKLLPVLSGVSARGRPVYALCKYPAWSCGVESCK